MLETLLENFDSFMADSEVAALASNVIGSVARAYQGKPPMYVGEIGDSLRKLVTYLRNVDSPAIKALPLMARTTVTSFAGAMHKTLSGE